MTFDKAILGGFAREITVGHVGPMVSEYVETGIPFLRSQNILPYRISTDEIKYISPEFHHKLRKSSLRPGDVVIVRTGKPGTCAVIPVWLEEANCSDLVIIRCGEALKPQYLSYWVNSLASHHIRSSLVGAVQQHFNVESARQMPFLLPDLKTQERVIAVLGSLNDKIDLNWRINETLEAMAPAIFRDWFVDFGPTRRKMEGTTDPVAILGGLIRDPEKAATITPYFPRNFADNGLPKEWEERPLDQIAKFVNGLALQKYPTSDPADSMPVIKIAELRNGVTAKSNRASRGVPEKYVIKDGDFLFSWSGSLMAKFWTGGEGALNQHLFKVFSDEYPTWFYTQWIHYHLAEFQQIAASKATTMGHIQRGHLKVAMTVCPPDEALHRLSEVMEPLTHMTVQNELENRTLAAARDFLLPKLMSGEIRLRDAEAMV